MRGSEQVYGTTRLMSTRHVVLIGDVSCRLEGFGVSVGRIGSTVSTKDVGETRRQ